jgi:hypothetical protein
MPNCAFQQLDSGRAVPRRAIQAQRGFAFRAAAFILGRPYTVTAVFLTTLLPAR